MARLHILVWRFVTPYNLVGGYRRFGLSEHEDSMFCAQHESGTFHIPPEEGNRILLRNVGNNVQSYIVSQE